MRSPLPSPRNGNASFRFRGKTYKDELEWLKSPAGKSAQNHGARVSQVTRAMGQCR